MEQHHQLLAVNGSHLHNASAYRRLVGRLIYMTITRPDLAYSVHVLSQFLAAPTSSHMEAALKLVKYLKQSPGQGILLSSTSYLSLSTYCDADWGGCKASRQSLTGFCIMLGQSLISWRSRKAIYSFSIFCRSRISHNG